jgi:hypothetical protein
MRKVRKLVLSIVTALTIFTLTAASASAVVSPNGDTEQDNWKAISNVKAFNYGNNTWSGCSVTLPAPAYCKRSSGEFTWHNRWIQSPGNVRNYPCVGASMTINLGGSGNTLISSADWTFDPYLEQSSYCWAYEPYDYTTNPAQQAALSGSICKHVPTGTFWLSQGIVVGDRTPPGPILYWQPTFARLTGNPYYFSATGSYPVGTGLQTAHLAVGSSTSYQAMGGAPASSTPGESSQYFEFPFHNVLLTPSTTACGWSGLT